MFGLILESLSSTELLFILVIALIFFGPRKLPQLAKSMGKGLAEFRKASDEFKRTWEREVAMEAAKLDPENMILEEERSVYEESTVYEENITPEPPPLIEPANPELVVAREADSQPAPEPVAVSSEPTPPGPMRKQDWF